MRSFTISRSIKINDTYYPWLSMMLSLMIIITIIASGLLFVAFNLPVWLAADGDVHFWQSQFYEAEIAYQRSLLVSPLVSLRSQAYARMCRLYNQQSDFEAALSYCQAAVQADGGNVTAQAELARTYQLMGKYELARQHASQALLLDEHDADAAWVLAEIIAAEAAASGSHDFTQAENFCGYALTLDEDNAAAYRAMGYINQLQGKFDEAASYYRQALEIVPEFAAYYVDLGHVEIQQNNLTAALDAFDRAVELSPQLVTALQGRGWSWWTQGDFQQARQDFKQALLLDDGDAESWAGLGWTYYYEGGTKMAQSAFEQALDINPENASAISGLDIIQNIPAQTAAVADTAGAVNNPVYQRSQVPRQMLDNAILAAVKIYAFDNNFEVQSACSGMVVSPEGLILTNLHCISDVNSQVPYNEQWVAGIGVVRDIKQPPEQRYRAKMVAMDENLDVVLLQVTSGWWGSPLADKLNLVHVKMGDSDSLNVGDTVWAAGFPGMGGDTLTLTQGMVSGFAVQDGVSWIKTDLMTGPGNSGGMVVNAAGELVGIHAQSWLDQGVASSRLSAELPINYLRSMKQIIE